MEKGKKVLFVGKFFYPPLGGGETFLLSILKKLKENGYNVSAVCYALPDTERTFQKNDYVDWQGIPVFQLSIKSLNDVFYFIQKAKPDLIFTQSFDAPEIVDFSKSLGIKTILGVHFWRNICNVDSCFQNMLDRPISSVELLTRKHRVFYNSDFVFANSEFMKEAVKKYVGFECKQIIHPIIDLQRVISERTNPEYITIINPDVNKGGQIFLHLAKKFPNYKFMCVGLGNESSAQNKELNRRILETKNIKLFKKTDKVSDIYKETKILLVPSLVDETFSMVTLEAMFNSIPVISSDRGNLRFLVEDGGYIIPVDDIQLYEEALKELCEDKELYEMFSKKTLEISKKYLPENEYEKIIKIVEELIG